MKKLFTRLLAFAAAGIISIFSSSAAFAQQFVHPGLNQSAKDLAYMKNLVQQGQEPWKSAFERLKASINLDTNIQAHTHIMRGPYGKPNIGGNELSKSAGLAYDCALVWYITGDKQYARKAIALLNAWPGTLWDFDYNDAKLLAAWTGHVLCNAAELLRYSNAGWQPEDIDRFTGMLMEVYYPLLRFYYPQANGNWDGAIIHSILSIAIFTGNRAMYNNAVDHFLHGPVNGSIFKYIFPTGQCQESMRDQGHVQLGLGEFAGAAQVAWTQGTDLFSIGDNRIARGFEYTADFLLGGQPYCYGPISQHAKQLRDDYEYVYRHYTAQGVYLPHVKQAADAVRPKATRSVLTAVRAPLRKPAGKPDTLLAGTGHIAGAGAPTTTAIPADAVFVTPEQSLQEALDKAAGANHWVVARKGIHKLPATLKIPSGVTLAGEGIETVLFLDPAAGMRDAVVNAADDLHDVTIRDLVIEGAVNTDPGTDPNGNRSFRNKGNRGGIIFRSEAPGKMQHLRFINLTVQNCTYNGIFVSGAAGVEVNNCNLNENGSSVVPGPMLQHNLLLTHCSNVSIRSSRLDTSPYGSGVAVDQCRDVNIDSCEIARNAYYGVLIATCSNVTVKDCLVEGNDRSGIMLEFLHRGTTHASIRNNRVRYNGEYGVASYAAVNTEVTHNSYAGNRKAPENISSEKHIILQ